MFIYHIHIHKYTARAIIRIFDILNDTYNAELYKQVFLPKGSLTQMQ